MIVVTTPNGNTGSHVLDMLVEHGASVRAVARHPDRIPPEIARRAEVVAGSLDDVAALRRGFAGATDVFFCVPQSNQWESSADYYGRFLDAALAAAQDVAPDARFVTVSGGGYGFKKPGLARQLGRMEDRLNATAHPTRHLRAGYFMENLLWAVESIRHAGVISHPIRGDVPLPFMAARDLATVAVRWLVDGGWRDQAAVAVHGPEHLTYTRAAEIISDALSRSVRYVEATDDQARELLLRIGSSSGFVEEYLEMCHGFSAGLYDCEPRTAETTTPTGLDAWCRANLRAALTV